MISPCLDWVWWRSSDTCHVSRFSRILLYQNQTRMRYLLFLLLLCSATSHAQKIPTIEEKTNGLIKTDGYIPFYRDEYTGKLWLEIARIDSEFLYQISLPAGLGSNDIGLDRGLLGNTAIVKFVRSGRKLLLVEPNYDYRAVTNDKAERRVVEQSFAQSALWGFLIEAESNGHVLVDATDFLLRDAMKAAGRIRS